MKAIYKCRLCGEKCREGAMPKAVLEMLLEKPAGECGELPPLPPMIKVHPCGGGGLGVADFQGWEE